TYKAPSDEGAVAKRLRERTCSVFSCIYQECESFQAFSPPVSFADSPLIRGGHWAAKRSFICVKPASIKGILTTSGKITHFLAFPEVFLFVTEKIKKWL
ncbi:MAG: hypothetical protein SPD81_09995, partial [Candidatus Faecousia sp.]|nr:hypothetical protein [Candidatus Faecousia sp.]